MTETGAPLALNFGKGGMKKLVNEMVARSAYVSTRGDASAYGV